MPLLGPNGETHNHVLHRWLNGKSETVPFEYTCTQPGHRTSRLNCDECFEYFLLQKLILIEYSNRTRIPDSSVISELVDTFAKFGIYLNAKTFGSVHSGLSDLGSDLDLSIVDYHGEANVNIQWMQSQEISPPKLLSKGQCKFQFSSEKLCPRALLSLLEHVMKTHETEFGSFRVICFFEKARVPRLKLKHKSFSALLDITAGTSHAVDISTQLLSRRANNSRFSLLVIAAKSVLRTYDMMDNSRNLPGAYAMTIWTLDFCKTINLIWRSEEYKSVPNCHQCLFCSKRQSLAQPALADVRHASLGSCFKALIIYFAATKSSTITPVSPTCQNLASFLVQFIREPNVRVKIASTVIQDLKFHLKEKIAISLNLYNLDNKTIAYSARKPSATANMLKVFSSLIEKLINPHFHCDQVFNM